MDGMDGWIDGSRGQWIAHAVPPLLEVYRAEEGRTKKFGPEPTLPNAN